jgi:hypothetical protein
MQLRVLMATTALAGSIAWSGVAAEDEKPARHRVTPNEEYRAGPLHRALFGTGYRRLWATPIEVEVLDLGQFSGGLRPKKTGGGKQTHSLTFEGGDGHDWKFRSVDKDPTPILPKALRYTYVDAVVQDQISASLPAGALIADALGQAAGVVTVPRRLFVMPDDPRLGEFRQQFAGMLGLLEAVPRTKAPATPGFERFSELIETLDLWERMDQDAHEQLDARAFLRARLLDLLIGDYDRHKDQWDFGKDRETGLWVPIPKDRDLAFVKFDGLAIDVARTTAPRLIDFEDKYPGIVGLTWQARYLDRRHLGVLEWADWQEIATDLRRRLTNPVIDDAVHRLPPEFYAIAGPGLTARLKKRRDALLDEAHRFYALLARDAEVHGTNQADTVETVRREDGGVDLVVSGPEGPYMRRRYVPGETSEVRVYLKGGDDRALSHGDGDPGVKVRVVGGAGNDVLDDGDGGHTRFYDSEGENRLVKGDGTRFSDRPYTQPVDSQDNPLRDWGKTTSIVPFLRAGAGLGVVLGMELKETGFGFRKHPYAHQHVLRLAYSTLLADFGGHYTYESLRTDSRARFAIDADISDLHVINYHGLGNETASPGPEEFYRVAQRQYSFSPSYRLELDPVDITVGPVVKFATTRFDDGPTLLSLQRPYGSDDFGELGARARIALDRRDRPGNPRKGVYVATEGTIYPKAWSVQETFGETQGEAAVYATAPMPLRPTLALRAAGQHVFGTYPFHEAAFLGGAHTVRALRSQRYAGDTAAYGNAELRLAFLDRPLSRAWACSAWATSGACGSRARRRTSGTTRSAGACGWRWRSPITCGPSPSPPRRAACASTCWAASCSDAARARRIESGA